MKSSLYELIILWIICSLNIAYIPTTAASRPQNAAIISGVRAVPGEYPWHVALKINPTDLQCGGSVISNTWVLTAAHCIRGMPSISMLFGTVELENSRIKMNSTRLFPHPSFNAPTYDNDIGLIELPTPLTFNVFIQPIALVTAAEAAGHNFINTISFISGFGYYNDNLRRVSPWLLWGSEKIVNKNICEQSYGPITDFQICAIGYTDDRQLPCKGDSGGPLVWRNDMRIHKQIGIASFGKLRQCSAYPAVFTRVSSYLNYINSITGLNFH